MRSVDSLAFTIRVDADGPVVVQVQQRLQDTVDGRLRWQVLAVDLL